MERPSPAKPPSPTTPSSNRASAARSRSPICLSPKRQSPSTTALTSSPGPRDAWPIAPEGLQGRTLRTGLHEPRLIRTAPNGDFFLADSKAGKIMVLRGVGADGKAARPRSLPPASTTPSASPSIRLGANPQWVYVANTTSVVRFPVQGRRPRRPRQAGDHRADASRRRAASRRRPLDPRRRLLAGRQAACSSRSAQPRTSTTPTTTPRSFTAPTSSSITPDGKFVKVYASGIRNCVGMAINPTTGQLWCSVNERDGLGDNLVPDYITSVKEGGFYGWPWYYIGGHQDPRHAGKHPELKSKVIVPDVLLQPHIASLAADVLRPANSSPPSTMATSSPPSTAPGTTSDRDRLRGHPRPPARTARPPASTRTSSPASSRATARSGAGRWASRWQRRLALRDRRRHK